MASILCPTGIDCPGSDFPITNYSAESGEQVPTYLALVFPETFDSGGCLSLCISTVSQQDADLCALAQAAACPPENPFFPPSPDDPNPDPPFPPPTSSRFFNAEQNCTKACPDGNEFTFTVPAGTFSASTQEAADARAEAYACQMVGNKQICIGVLDTDGICVGSSYSDTIPVLVSSGLVLTVSISAGALPTGITMTVVSITPTVTNIDLLGVPTTTGQYDFTILAQDAAGNMQSKEFSIFVLQISPDTLPNATEGVAYSQFLTVLGPTLGTVLWSITSGSLPTGLTLNAVTGEISGTPTVSAAFNFTATVSDDR